MFSLSLADTCRCSVVAKPRETLFRHTPSGVCFFIGVCEVKRLFCIVCVLSILLSGCTTTEITESTGSNYTEVVGKDYTEGVYELRISKRQLSNNAVGNDWSFRYFYNGEEIKNGHTFTLSLELFMFVSIDVEVTEEDKISDVGNGKITLGLCDGGKGKTEVTVVENAGAFKGNEAVWEITCEFVMVGKQ